MADVYEKDLAQKTSLTTSDYIRVVGSDNVSYKQSIPSVANIFGIITRLNSDTDDYDTLYGDSPSFKVYAVGNRVQHAPDGQWFFLTSYRAENSYITQVAYGMTTSDIFTRRFQIGTTGTAWTKLPTRAEVDAITPKYTDVTATTTSTGAFSIPTALQSKAIIDAYPTNTTAIALRRDTGYFMVKDATDMTAKANTSITLRIWHY